MSKELLKRALKRVYLDNPNPPQSVADMCKEIETELANPDPEPVAYYCKNDPDTNSAFSWQPGKCSNCGGVLQPLYAEPVDQSARIAELTKRLRIAEDVIYTSKLESKCKTADDWKHKAEWYEYNWRTCSEGFNATASDLKSQLAELQAKREPLSDGITDMWLNSMGNIYKFARMIEKAHGITS